MDSDRATLNRESDEHGVGALWMTLAAAVRIAIPFRFASARCSRYPHRVIPIVVIRHPKERRSKCSLRGLDARPDFTFKRGTPDLVYPADNHLMLSMDAPILTRADYAKGRPLLILDSTWRLLPKLEARLTGSPIRRSLPEGIATAYPRDGTLSPNPDGGLASVEAIFIAKLILGERDETVLAGYRWRDSFLATLEEYERHHTPLN